jgi:hypothetical protein
MGKINRNKIETITHQRRRISTGIKSAMKKSFITTICTFAAVGSDGFVFNHRRQVLSRRAAKSSKVEQEHPYEETSELPPNEFSRTFQIDRILKTRKGANGISNSNYFYPVAIEANEMECIALARRFDLSSINNLSASLQLRPSSLNTGGIGSGSIEVEGVCKSVVVQRCVRTNEDFEVALEFPIYSVVRPVIPNNNGILQQDSSSTIGSYQQNNEYGENNEVRKMKTSNKKSYRIADRNIDEMDVMELQRMLQSDMNHDNDVLMEDEAIYSVNDGQIDVGELVSQLFWFTLDPYPKKPGTDPIQRSITG